MTSDTVAVIRVVAHQKRAYPPLGAVKDAIDRELQQTSREKVALAAGSQLLAKLEQDPKLSDTLLFQQGRLSRLNHSEKQWGSILRQSIFKLALNHCDKIILPNGTVYIVCDSNSYRTSKNSNNSTKAAISCCTVKFSRTAELSVV